MPALLVTKNSRTFQDPRSIPWPCRKPAMLKYRDKQQLPTIYICIYIYVCACVFITVTFCEETAKKLFKHRRVQKRIFWRLHLHHCWANSRTVHLDFQDQTYIQELSWLITVIWNGQVQLVLSYITPSRYTNTRLNMSDFSLITHPNKLHLLQNRNNCCWYSIMDTTSHINNYIH